TYRLTPLSLWNAAAAGLSAAAMIEVLRKYSKFPLPANLGPDLAEIVSRYGRVKLEKYEAQKFDGQPTTDETASKPGVETPAFVRPARPSRRRTKSPPPPHKPKETPKTPPRPPPLLCRAGPPGRPKTGAHRRRLPRRGPGRLPPRRRPADGPALRRAERPA